MGKPVVRVGFLLALGAVLLALVGVVGLVLYQRAAATPTPRDVAAQGRQERETPAAAVALAPLPVAVPLVSRPGKDTFGYPRSYVDRAAMRSLLGRAKYAELSRYIEQFQGDFERDFHEEYRVSDSADAFKTAESELAPALDAWVKATPDSFAPYLARGAHRFASGFAGRGTDSRAKTHDDNIAAMESAFELAFADLEQALLKNPHLVAALRVELLIAMAGKAHRLDFERLAKRAFAACPSCFQVRVTYQVGLQPRWNGSYEQMAAAAGAAPIARNPRFVQLPGYAKIDQAKVLSVNKKYGDALAAAEAACALGDNADFLETKADILGRTGDIEGALRTYAQVLDLRPQHESALYARVRLLGSKETQQWQAAYDDLVLALRLQPASPEAHELLPFVAQGLVFTGWEAHKQSREAEALRLLDEAAELDPSRDVEQRRMAVLTAGFHGTDPELSALDAAAKESPHDFYAHQRFDYALSTRRDWPRIAAMWTVFIAENPGDARAYLERSGTYHNQGRATEAHADAVRACELGSSAGCAYAKLP